MQVPLLTVLESVAFERVRGRSPLFQSWFDIQPLSLESDLSLEGLQAVACGKVRLSRLAVMLRPGVHAVADLHSDVHHAVRSPRPCFCALPAAILTAMSVLAGCSAAFVLVTLDRFKFAAGGLDSQVLQSPQAISGHGGTASTTYAKE